MLAFAQLKGSNQRRRRVGRDWDDESIYELYYAIQVTPWLVISTDIQYIDNPGANQTVSHAWVGGIRVRLTF